jgi:hypothetical protein
VPIQTRQVLRRLRLEFVVTAAASLVLAAATVVLALQIDRARGTLSLQGWLEIVPYARAL